MEEKEKDRDAVRKENTQLDDQRRQQDRALDKLNKEVCAHQHEFESVLSFYIFISSSFTLSFLISLFCFLLRLSLAFSVRWNACLLHPVRRCGSCRLSWMSKERSGRKSSRTRIKTPKRSSVSWRELRAPFIPYRRRCHTGLLKIFLLLFLIWLSKIICQQFVVIQFCLFLVGPSKEGAVLKL